MLQPALTEVGKRWAASDLSVAEEHRFTAMCASVTELVWGLYADQVQFRNSEKPRVLLANAPGNYHVLGIHFLEVLFTAHEVPNFAIYPGVPAAELFDLTKKLKPRFVGFSVSRSDQVEAVGEACRLIRTLPEGPRIVLGGAALKTGEKIDPSWGAEVCVDARAFLSLVCA
jgi:methanogenic corrinoid protein MtbC1